MGTQVTPTPNTVVEREPAKVAPPPMYQVVLLNDDYTPMDFVVVVVQHVFGKSRKKHPHYVEECTMRAAAS